MVASIATDSPALVTVPNVELLEVGENWVCSTGVFTITVEDLQSAIASQADPFVRTPIIKLGHTDPRFDGDPAMGRITNLHLSENKQTLLGDLTGVPRWLAECMASAYPRRSIEGSFEATLRSGKSWPFVLEAVALLGEAYPAIGSLEDVQMLYGGDAPVLVPVADNEHVLARHEGGPEVFVHPEDVHYIAATRPVVNPDVMAAASVDDVANAFYTSSDLDSYWTWIREIRVGPTELIVDDDEGHLYRIPFSLNASKDGMDAVSFGEKQEVRIQYVDVIAAGQSVVKRFGNPVMAGRPRVKAAVSDTLPPTNQKGTDMTPSVEVLTALGLTAEATEDEINAAFLAKLTVPVPDPLAPVTDPPTPPPAGEIVPIIPPAPVVLPEGMSLIDNTMLEEMREGVAASRQYVADRDNQNRSLILDAAIKAGKFAPARRDHFEILLKADPEGTVALFESMAAGAVPIKERGHEGSAEVPITESAYPDEWGAVVKASQRRNSSRISIAAGSD
jgi:hypothetical protein